MQCLRDSQTGCGQQAEQCCISPWLQRIGRRKPCGSKDEPLDLGTGINVRDATRLSVTEVIRRRRLVLAVLHAKVLSKKADSLVTRMALRDRPSLTGPLDDGRDADMRLLFTGRKYRKAAQEIF